MPLNNIKIGTGTLYCGDVPLMELSKMDIEPKEKYETNKKYKFSDFYGEATLDFSANCSKTDFMKCFGLDESKMPDKYDIQYQKAVQNRKHKKKRINKKWAKRYGYRMVTVNAEGFQLKTYTDGSFEFVSKGTRQDFVDMVNAK